jgi:cytosine/uracil/thiamine/allantoin permease
MREFLKFLLIWISQNLAIPFWMIGHIHLSIHMSIYQDLHIILASLGMNIIVAIGFWIDYKSQKDK